MGLWCKGMVIIIIIVDIIILIIMIITIIILYDYYDYYYYDYSYMMFRLIKDSVQNSALMDLGLRLCGCRRRFGFGGSVAIWGFLKIGVPFLRAPLKGILFYLGYKRGILFWKIPIKQLLVFNFYQLWSSLLRLTKGSEALSFAYQCFAVPPTWPQNMQIRKTSRNLKSPKAKVNCMTTEL